MKKSDYARRLKGVRFVEHDRFDIGKKRHLVMVTDRAAEVFRILTVFPNGKSAWAFQAFQTEGGAYRHILKRLEAK